MKETIIRQYRKKPVIVEAVQLDNINVPCVVRWIGEDKAKMKLESDEAWKLGKAPPIFSITISTLEGDMKAMPGDYIIKGVGGEFYPCKPDIFEKTYEADKPKEKTPETNYQRFVRKTPEELAEWLSQGCCPSDHGGSDIGGKKGYCSDYSCKDCWLDWMMQEAEE